MYSAWLWGSYTRSVITLPSLWLYLRLSMIYKARQHLLAVDSLQLWVGKVTVKVVVQASGLLCFERRLHGDDHFNMCLFDGAEVLVHVEMLYRSRRLHVSARGTQGCLCDISWCHHVDINKRNLPIEAFQICDAAHIWDSMKPVCSRLTTMAATE